MQKFPKLTYRLHKPSDNSFLTQITLETMEDVFQRSVNIPLTKENILARVENSSSTVIIEKNKKPIGYYCYDKIDSDRIYWAALILIPEEQNKGYGHQIVKDFEKKVAQLSVRIIDGHVQIANQNALAFWLKHGFQIIGPTSGGSIPIQKVLKK